LRSQVRGAVALHFPGDDVSLTIEPLDVHAGIGESHVRVEQWDGRNAFSLPAAAVRRRALRSARRPVCRADC
jgi:hypothetical protein